MQTSTEKVGNKINIYQNKSKILNCDSGRPNNCITEKYLENDKHIEKRKKIVNMKTPAIAFSRVLWT